MTEALVCVLGNDATIVSDTLHSVIGELLDGLDAAMALEDRQQVLLSATTAFEEAKAAFRQKRKPR